MSSAPVGRPPVGPFLVAGVAGAAHLYVGFFYLAGGLVIPLPVLVPLWVLWIALAVWLVRLAVRGSWWTPVAPLVAAVVLVATATIGETIFGWTA